MVDYTVSKSAIHTFTRSLAQSLAQSGVRVNCIAPGPVWTPLIPSTFSEEKVSGFGSRSPMGRMAHPDEIAPVGGETHPG